MTLAKPPTPMPIPLPPLGSELLAAQLVAAETAAEPPELRRWVSFWLGEARYALEIRQLREVLAETRPEPVPGAPAAVLGVINLRGEIVTLLDLGRWLGQAPARADGPVLVLEQGGYSLGLRVDAMAALLKRMPDEVLAPAPGASPALQALVCGATADGGEILTLLDAAPLLAPQLPAAHGG
jgi:purine-binding chemotaxis protein CheW